MTNMEKKYIEQQSVRKTILHLAIPSFVAQLVSILYNMVDRIYLGRIEGEGTMILAGLGLTLPIITMINAFANLVGLGGSPLVAIATVISQGVCSVLILNFLLGKKTNVQLQWIPLEKNIVKKITALDFSTFFWNVSESLVKQI